MTNKIILAILASLLTKQALANKPITLFIPPAMADVIEHKNYIVPNLQTGRDTFMNNASASNTNTTTLAPSTNMASSTTTNNTNIIQPLPNIIRHKKHFAHKFTPQQEQALHITEAYGDGSATPIIGEAGRTVFVYGHKQPTIICAPYTVCMIELEKNEQVLHYDAGDFVRRLIDPPQNGASYISIKPTYADIQTNLVVVTNKRTYTFKLQSTNNRYMSIVSFKYPSNHKEKWEAYYMLNNLQNKAQQSTINQAVATNNENLLQGKNLDYNYSYTGDAPFKPVRIWTDNVKTYIQLPKSVLSAELPVFQNVSRFGATKLVNQRYDAGKNIIEIDYKVERGQLKLGQQKDKQIIDIIYTMKSNQMNTTTNENSFVTER